MEFVLVKVLPTYHHHPSRSCCECYVRTRYQLVCDCDDLYLPYLTLLYLITNRRCMSFVLSYKMTTRYYY